MDNPSEQYDSEENKEQYEKEQYQRTLKRRIRKTKRECIGLKESVRGCKDEKAKFDLDMHYQRKARLLSAQNKAYKDYCEREGLKPLSDRIQIAQWDRKQAAMARAAARENTVVKSGKNVTIKLQAEVNKMITPYEKKVLDAVPKKDGFFDFAAHGSSTNIEYGSRERVLNAREVANIIKHNELYHGEKVRLLSCSTGSTKNGFVQQLANVLGVEIEALSDVLIVSPDGSYKVGYDGSGEMITFKPNGRK